MPATRVYGALSPTCTELYTESVNSLKSDLSSLKEEVASGNHIILAELRPKSDVISRFDYYGLNGKVSSTHIYTYEGTTPGYNNLSDRVIGVVYNNTTTAVNQYEILGAWRVVVNGVGVIRAHVAVSQTISQLGNMPQLLYAGVYVY